MDKKLVLPYEAIASLPGGVNEVRLYLDPILGVQRVSKRLDRSMVAATVLPEASTLQAIDHENVVKVLHAVHVEGYSDPLMDVIEIVTPYYERGSITDALLNGETFVPSEALAIVQAALRGLRELHMTHRVLHRDIKSGNILLADPPIRALVADIGVAGRIDDDGVAPAVNNPTPYSPPELRTGLLQASADLYSLALVLRELIGGRFDYEAISRDEVSRRLAAGQRGLADDQLELPVWAPHRLRRVYAKATALDPAKRFQSAREMSAALAKVKLAAWIAVSDREWRVSVEGAPKSRVLTIVASPSGSGFILSMTKPTRAGPRRVQGHPDVMVPSLDSKEARDFFDRANSLMS